MPQWEDETCIQCNQCAYVCPHAAIRPFILTDEEVAAAPAGTAVKPATGKELKGMHFRIQVAVEDCTGCGNCVDVCPAPNAKALVMKHLETQDAERERWHYMDQTVGYKDLLPKNNVKNTQFAQPLFEFSGACAGCGETPYIKLITQLYGERMMVANRGANDYLKKEEAISCIDEITDTKIVYFSGYSFLSRTNSESVLYAIEECYRQNCKIYFNPGAPNLMEKKFKEIVRDFVDVLILNKEEARNMSEKDEIEEVSKTLNNIADTVVITMNDGGCVLAREDEYIQIETEKLNVLDTTGAGDAFAAGFIIGELKGKKYDYCAKIGNDTGPYQTTNYYGVSQSQLPYPIGSMSGSLAFQNFKPEITTSWEIGTELSLLGNMFDLELVYYDGSSKNQIMNVLLAPSSGFSTMKQNAGEIRNRGYEALFTSSPLSRPNGLSWDLSLNLSDFNNERFILLKSST